MASFDWGTVGVMTALVAPLIKDQFPTVDRFPMRFAVVTPQRFWSGPAFALA